MFIQQAERLPWMVPNTKIGRQMSNKLKQKNKNGFTLIEILIVFTLIGILVGMGLPQFRNSTTRAREAVLKENLFQMRILINQYYTDKGKFPASLQTLVDEEYMRTIPEDPITKSTRTWIEMQQTLSEDDLAQNVEVGISDVFSGSEKKALDGTLYSTW